MAKSMLHVTILLALFCSASYATDWNRSVEIDPADVKGGIAKFDSKRYVNYYTGRWPCISFIGGMAMGNRSEELEFFYSEPFKWHTTILDYVLENGGKVYGLRVKLHRREGAKPKPRSFLLHIRTDVLLSEYHPSYILVNGRRVWDFKKHKLGAGGIDVPFSVAEPADLVIDWVIDQEYTPDTKGLAFRMFNVNFLGQPGDKIDLAGAESAVSGSPADGLKKFSFGLFPSGYDFWTNRGKTFGDIEKEWKPNFIPDYPTDEIVLSAAVWQSRATGKYQDFMVRYGGCNYAGEGATAELFRSNPYLRGVLVNSKNADDLKRALAVDPKTRVLWFRGENPTPPTEGAAVDAAKTAAGDRARITAAYEPFPPRLSSYHEYERGSDMLVLKNEEDPQANILVSMARGAGRTFGKPYGFYWEQTHYPFPSLDEKLHACLLYYLSGGSLIGAEAENAPSFANDVVADWVYPYVQALRFAMVHPARGKSIVPIGVIYSTGDAWWIPYNPFGQMDTFVRYVEYDNVTNTLTCEPNFTKIFPWMPQANPKAAGWRQVGHLNQFIDKLDELQGYNLLDVFFPKYGDAYTAHITRLMTGTPYGPLDFVPLEKASPEHLKSFGLLVCLGHGQIRADAEAKLLAAAENGTQIVLGVQDFLNPSGAIQGKPFGLTLEASGGNNVRGELFRAHGSGWEVVSTIGDKPLIVRENIGKGAVYIYLGRWIHQGGDALRSLLANLAQQAAPLKFNQPDDQLEYVAYRKNQGAFVALLNHGNIVIGCDRLDPDHWRVAPPEPLFTKVKGQFGGAVEFRLERLGLDPHQDYSLYEAIGIDEPDFDGIISGKKTFHVREMDCKSANGVLTAVVKFNKRAEYVIAPKGKGGEVFFGKP